MKFEWDGLEKNRMGLRPQFVYLRTTDMPKDDLSSILFMVHSESSHLSTQQEYSVSCLSDALSDALSGAPKDEHNFA